MKRRVLQQGFSLVELLIATFVGAILAGGVITIMVSQLQLNASHNRNMANQQNMRDSVNYMLDEISLCGSNVPEPFVLVATATQFKFYGDVNGDQDWDELDYAYDGNGLVRTFRTTADGGASWSEPVTDTLLQNVSDFAFTYYAAGNVETDVEDQISSIAVSLTLTSNASTTAFTSDRTRDYSMNSRVTLRNRRI